MKPHRSLHLEVVGIALAIVAAAAWIGPAHIQRPETGVQLAQYGGAIGEDDGPIGGPSAYGEPVGNGPIGGPMVYGEDVGNAPIGGQMMYGEPVGNGPIGGPSMYGAPVDSGGDGQAIGGDGDTLY